MKKPVDPDTLYMANVRSISPEYKDYWKSLNRQLPHLRRQKPRPKGREVSREISGFQDEDLEIHKACDVVISAAHGLSDVGVLGDMIAFSWKKRGASGVVTDAAIRDTPNCMKSGLPILTAGYETATALTHLGRGVVPTEEVNMPVVCDGVQVREGDVIVGDENGVMVIPKEMTNEIAERAAALEELEEVGRRLITEGIPEPDVHLMKMEYIKKYGLTGQWKILQGKRKKD